MRYDFDYFHKNLLVNQNVRYEQYKDKTEFDIFMSQLSYEAVYDKALMGLTIQTVEKNVAQPIAATILWDGQDNVKTDYIYEFWNRH